MRFFTFFLVLMCVSSSVQPWSLFRRKQAPKKEEVAAPEIVVTETEEELLAQQAKYKALYDRILGAFGVAAVVDRVQLQSSITFLSVIYGIPLSIFLSSATTDAYLRHKERNPDQPFFPRPSLKGVKLPKIAKEHPYVSGVLALGGALYGARWLKRFIRQQKKARIRAKAAQTHDIFASTNAGPVVTRVLTSILVEWPTLKKEFPEEVTPLLDALYKRFSLDGRLPVKKELRAGIVVMLFLAVSRNKNLVDKKLAILQAKKKSQKNEKGTTEKVARVSRPMGDFFE